MKWKSSFVAWRCYQQQRTLKIMETTASPHLSTYLLGCFLRYLDHSFSGEAVDGSDATICGNSTMNGLNSTRFTEMVNQLVVNWHRGWEGMREFMRWGVWRDCLAWWSKDGTVLEGSESEWMQRLSAECKGKCGSVLAEGWSMLVVLGTQWTVLIWPTQITAVLL